MVVPVRDSNEVVPEATDNYNNEKTDFYCPNDNCPYYETAEYPNYGAGICPYSESDECPGYGQENGYDYCGGGNCSRGRCRN